MSNTGIQFPKTSPTPRFDAFSKEVEHIRSTWLVWYRMFSDCDALHDHRAFNEHKTAWNSIYHGLFRDVLLGLARLVDRKEMQGRQNLTVDQIWEEMSFAERDNLQRAAEAARRDFMNSTTRTDLLHIRHRVLAHNDIQTILGHEEIHVEIERVRLAVEWLCKFKWRCESLYEGRIVDYGAPISAVHRDCSTDFAIEREVDDLLKRICPPRSPRSQHRPR